MALCSICRSIPFRGIAKVFKEDASQSRGRAAGLEGVSVLGFDGLPADGTQASHIFLKHRTVLSLYDHVATCCLCSIINTALQGHSNGNLQPLWDRSDTHLEVVDANEIQDWHVWLEFNPVSSMRPPIAIVLGSQEKPYQTWPRPSIRACFNKFRSESGTSSYMYIYK
jgi:hypothetical protein